MEINDDDISALRDWFAGLAMQGTLANPDMTNLTYRSVSKSAYAMADAMLEERDNVN